MKNSLNALDCPILSTARLLIPNDSCAFDATNVGGTEDDDDVVNMLDDNDVASDEVTVVVEDSFDVDVIWTTEEVDDVIVEE